MRPSRSAGGGWGAKRWLRHPPAAQVPGSGPYHAGRGEQGWGHPLLPVSGAVGGSRLGRVGGEADCTSPAGWGGKGNEDALLPLIPPHWRERTVYPGPAPPAPGAILGATKTTSLKSPAGPRGLPGPRCPPGPSHRVT